MKNIKCLGLLLSFIVLLIVGNGLEVSAQESELDHFSIQVDGLGCPFCAYGLEKKFKEFEGIENIEIDMETGMFTFTLPAEDSLGLEPVSKQVEVAGYTPVTTKIKRANGEVFDSSIKEEVVLNSETNEVLVEKSDLFVFGNCGMCKSRIDKAVSDLEGIVFADWDIESKILSVHYDKEMLNLKEIEKVIVAKGHDTKAESSQDAVYEALPECCQYDRE